MNRVLLIKITLIAVLILLLTIPLAMIRGVISERSYYRNDARNSIAESWTGAQRFLGPIVVVPYRIQHERKVWDKNSEQYETELWYEAKRIYLLPEELTLRGQLATEERSRGLYEVPVYRTDLQLTGSFQSQPVVELARGSRDPIEWDSPYLAVTVEDIRGVVSQPQLNWQGTTQEFLSGSGLPKIDGGMHAPLPLFPSAEAGRYEFSFALRLHGMESLQFSPVGKSTSVILDADWPHPSFSGRYLPSERTIDNDHFSARWQVSSFSSDMARALALLEEGNSAEFLTNTFGVSLVSPVDIYQQTDRAIKYGLMFVTLTFVVFFLFEVMKRLRLHPMHYLLVGSALTLFYLLLIALSEHIAFAGAYGIAAVACVGLIGFYVSAVLQSWLRALAVTGLLAILYAMLYFILQSEDNALLMGALLLFAVLSLVMVVTRKVDWYAIGEQMGRHKERRPAGPTGDLGIDGPSASITDL